MNKPMAYKGYTAKIEYSDEDGIQQIVTRPSF